MVVPQPKSCINQVIRILFRMQNLELRENTYLIHVSGGPR